MHHSNAVILVVKESDSNVNREQSQWEKKQLVFYNQILQYWGKTGFKDAVCNIDS